MKVIKLILIFPILFILFGVIFTELNKMYWDNKIKTMCDKDAGLTIYEKVTVSENQYKVIRSPLANVVILPLENKMKSGDPYFIRYDRKKMGKIFLYITRDEQFIVRRSDGKILSEVVSYSRVGGDFPVGFEQSYSSCGRDESELKLLNTVVTIEEN